MSKDGERAKQLKQIAKAYEAGTSWKDLAKKFKVGFKTISAALEANKTKRRNETSKPVPVVAKAKPASVAKAVAIRADLVRSLVDNVVEAADGRPVQSVHINVNTGSVTISYIENKVLNFKG
jgi:hypothetical protein